MTGVMMSITRKKTNPNTIISIIFPSTVQANIPLSEYIGIKRMSPSKVWSGFNMSTKTIGAIRMPIPIPPIQDTIVLMIASLFVPATIPIIIAMMKITGMGPDMKVNQPKTRSVRKRDIPTIIARLNSSLTTQ